MVVNDGSRDGTAAYLNTIANSDRRIAFVNGNGNLWWAKGLNTGIRAAVDRWGLGSADLILTMNNDTTFGPDFLEAGLAALPPKRRTMVCADCYSQTDPTKHLNCGLHLTWDPVGHRPALRPDEVDCLMTRGLLFRLEDFKHLGPFHGRLIPHYLSDLDFTYRAYRRGYSLIVEPSFRLFLNQQTTTNVAGQVLPWFKKHFDLRSPEYFPAWWWFIALNCPRKHRFAALLWCVKRVVRWDNWIRRAKRNLSRLKGVFKAIVGRPPGGRGEG